jgi:HK97 gp10 family phage protein
MARSRVLNLDRLNAKLARVPARAKAEIKLALDKGGDEIVRSAKVLVQEDSGDLGRSIQKQPGRHEFEVQVVAGGEATTRPVRKGVDSSYDYAMGNELGTKEMPAQPFLRPAFRLVAKRVNGRVRRAVNKAAKAEAGGQ